MSNGKSTEKIPLENKSSERHQLKRLNRGWAFWKSVENTAIRKQKQKKETSSSNEVTEHWF